jgi:hypothetical protein
MRIMLALPLLLVAGCNLNNDEANDQMTLEYNQQRIEDAAATAANTAEEVGSSIGNIAESTGAAISNEVGDIDVDVNINRDKGGEANANKQ